MEEEEEEEGETAYRPLFSTPDDELGLIVQWNLSITVTLGE